MFQKLLRSLRRLVYPLVLFGVVLLSWWSSTLTTSTPANAQTATTCAAIDPNSYYQITAKHSGQSLDVFGGSQDNDAKIIQYPYGGGANQQWQFKATDSGYYTLTARHSQKNIDVAGASQANAAPIVQWPNTVGATHQQWCFKSVGNGYYNITARHSQQNIDVPNGSQANATQVTQFPDNGGGPNQQWLLTAVATIPAAAPPAAQGQWSAKINWPSIPVAAALLPTGKVVTWSSYDRNTFGNNPGAQQTYTALFDPKTNGITENLVGNTSHDMFCPGTAMLQDGRLLVNGGGPTVTSTSIFNSKTNAWSSDANMGQRRWYNTSIALPDGGVFTLGGNRTAGGDGRGEIWQAGQGWRTLTGAVMDPLYSGDPQNRAQEHPKLVVAPNGKLFAAGPTPNMQWYDLAGNGTVQSAGRRGTDDFSQNGVFVNYDVGKILKAGGNPNYDGANSDSAPSSTSTYVIDLNQGGAAQPVQSMRYPRSYANGVVLPDGQVLVVGGLNNGKAFSDNGAILAPEMFDPGSNTWSTMANMATPRTYHSVALLLPDGRVLAGGGGLCGGCNVNHSDAEIFSPPYLFKGARPTIASAPGTIGYNRDFNVQASGNVTQFSLVRLSSVTHSVNTDQRFQRVSFQKTGNTYKLNLQANANITPPGYYMLFALNNQGVPSVSKILKVGA